MKEHGEEDHNIMETTFIEKGLLIASLLAFGGQAIFGQCPTKQEQLKAIQQDVNQSILDAKEYDDDRWLLHLDERTIDSDTVMVHGYETTTFYYFKDNKLTKIEDTELGETLEITNCK